MKYQDFSFYQKIRSSSGAVKLLFLSFTCEDIGVAMVTNMISQLQESFPFSIEFSKFSRQTELLRTLWNRLNIFIFFAHSWEILSALEDKIHIPARPCNILYFYSFNLPYQMSDGRKAITRICFKVQLQVVINQYG